MTNVKRQYAIYGILFGLMFPCMSIVFECIRLDLDISFESVVFIHTNNPLIYIIDSAPIWLGVFALLGGISKAKSLELLFSIKKIVNILQKNSEELKHYSGDGFQNLNNQSSQLSITLEGASVQMQSVDNLITKMSDQATTLKNDADKIIDNTQKLINLNDSLKLANDRLSVIITGFISKVKEMEKYLNKVSSLGTEINTLSINSSIEAYKMGVNGSGFSVIALNIKSISDQLYQMNSVIKNINKEVEKDINEISVKITEKESVLKENGQASSFIEERISSYQFQLNELINNVEILGSANNQQKQNFMLVNSTFEDVLDTNENMVNSMDNLLKKEFDIINELSKS